MADRWRRATQVEPSWTANRPPLPPPPHPTPRRPSELRATARTTPATPDSTALQRKKVSQSPFARRARPRPLPAAHAQPQEERWPPREARRHLRQRDGARLSGYGLALPGSQRRFPSLTSTRPPLLQAKTTAMRARAPVSPACSAALAPPQMPAVARPAPIQVLIAPPLPPRLPACVRRSVPPSPRRTSPPTFHASWPTTPPPRPTRPLPAKPAHLAAL